jgi:pyruvate decarboxylase
MFDCGEGRNCSGVKVTSSAMLDAAIRSARELGGVRLIECVISRDDCSSELLHFGARVAAVNGRV